MTTRLEELYAAWEAAYDAAIDAGEAEVAANYIARAAYRAELKKQENSDD
jgi:hypothetical protein